MKKYLIGLMIGFIFIAYSLIVRNQHSETILPPGGYKGNTNTLATTSSGSNTSGYSGSQTTEGSNTSQASNTTQTSTPKYKDGSYTGSVANAYYGNVQVSASISGGKITTIDFIQSPNENPNSIYVNSQADPYLKQEAIKSQSPNVGIITGATLTSQAFIQSLSNALNQAKE